MADTIARLRLNSDEWDSKIKRAVTGLQQMEDECRKVGGTLAILEKDQLDYVKALGQMQTVATTAKGKLAELTSAYTELRVQYNRLTDEEKKGDFGKALNSSLAQLKTRIDDTKKELGDVNRELGNTSQASEGAGNAIEQFTSKLGLNVKQLVGWGTAIAAAKAALDIAKDAFFASETNVDTWGRTVASAQGVYESFLQTLNNGDFSGFFSGIDSVINKAKEAYNAMDELQTRMTIINPERAKLQRDQQKYRAIIRRKGKDSEEGKAASEALKTLEPQLENAYKVEAGLNYNAFQKEVDRKLATAGIKLKKPAYDLLMRSFSSDEAYQRLRAGATGRAGHMEGGEKGAASQRWVADSRNTNQKLLDLFTDEWRKQYSPYLTATYNAQGQAYGVQLQNSRYLKEGGGGSGGGSSTTKAAAVTTKLTEEEKEAARQAKALAEAEKKRAEQLDKLRAEGAEAVRNNSLKSAFAVQKKAQEGGYMGDTSIPLSFTMTQDNVSALMSELKTQIGQSDIGSDMYNALTEQLNDVTSLSSLINYAMKNGIDGAELADVSQTMWQQLLGEGDIPDEALQSFKDSIGEALGKSLEFDSEGNVKEGENAGDKSWKEFQNSITRLSGVMSGVSTIGSGLQAMGIKLDEDVLNTIKGIQGAISVVQGVISVINAMSVPSENLNTVATNLNTTAIGSLIGALSTNSILHAIPGLANGGLIGRAAEGMLIPGNSYSGDRLRLPVDGGRGLIGVNSGELILNMSSQNNLAKSLINAQYLLKDMAAVYTLSHSQQNNFAAQLEGGGALQNLHLEAQVSAEDIRFVLSAASSRQNNTEYLNFDFV